MTPRLPASWLTEVLVTGDLLGLVLARALRRQAVPLAALPHLARQTAGDGLPNGTARREINRSDPCAHR